MVTMQSRADRRIALFRASLSRSAASARLRSARMAARRCASQTIAPALAANKAMVARSAGFVTVHEKSGATKVPAAIAQERGEEARPGADDCGRQQHREHEE